MAPDEAKYPVRPDSSLAVLIGANLVALAVAYAMGMGLRNLMLIYWIQSVIIGLCTVVRIASLASFSTDSFKMNGRPVAASAATRRRVAFFFVIHYGIFHAVYLAFVAFGSRGGELGSPAGYVVCGLIFAANHGYSLLHNLRRDAQGRPNIGTLMFLPYARILPMHLTILAGGAFFGGTFAFFLFGLLKTLADVVMHAVEHYVLGARLSASV
jgi:hypothetical protein